MNGYIWSVHFISPVDDRLIDRSGKMRVATTDPNTQSIYVSRGLSGDFLATVLTHELGHVAMFSYGLVDQLHRMVQPEYWVDIEEWICNFVADYGYEISDIVSDILQYASPYKLQVL